MEYYRIVEILLESFHCQKFPVAALLIKNLENMCRMENMRYKNFHVSIYKEDT